MKLSALNLRKTFHDAHLELTVIEDLTFTFPESGSIAIVGRSGIGKSTLLHLLGGLEQPSRGSINYDGVSLTNLSIDELSRFRGESVGFVFQFHHLLPEFTAHENVMMPLVISGCTDEEAEDRAAAVLDRVGLSSRISHRPGQLSGGEQQRVALARAIVTRPLVILADEPTGNLDVTTAKGVQELLLEVNEELGNILIVVTHSAELADSMNVVLEMLPGGELRFIKGK